MSDLIVLNEENANVYDRLVVSLEAGLGTLQILLAVCDNSALRQEIIRRYEQELGEQGVRGYRLALNPDEPSLLQALIDGKIEFNQEAIATVLGAEKLSNLGTSNRERLDSFLGYLQWTREALRGYPLPIVLWLPSTLLVEVAQKAPDFWSWRSGGVFKFNNELKIPIVKPVVGGRPTIPISIEVNNPLHTHNNSVLSLHQLENSLTEALTNWEEDNPNIEPIYAQLGITYAQRVLKGESENQIQEVSLAKSFLNKAISLQKRYNLKYDLTYSLSNLGDIYSFSKNWNEAESVYQESLLISKEIYDRLGMATSLKKLGFIERNRGNWEVAKKLYNQSMQLFQELHNQQGMADLSELIGDIEEKMGNLDFAEMFYRQSLQLRELLDDQVGMANSWGALGIIEFNRGNWDVAEILIKKRLKIVEELGNSFSIAICWALLGDIERVRGNWNTADTFFRQSLQIMEELDEHFGIANCLASLGFLENLRGNWNAAEIFYKQYLQVMEELDNHKSIAGVSFVFALLSKQGGNFPLAQQYYDKAKTIYQQLGAIKELEHIEKEWNLID